MNYNKEYNTRDSLVSLLRDFLSNITEEYEVSEDIIQVLSTSANKEYIEKIKTELTLYCPEDFEEKFSQTIDFVLLGDIIDFSEFDIMITNLYEDIERLFYKSENSIQEGIYKSDYENLTIGTTWTSKGSNMIGDPCISVHMRPHKKHINSKESDNNISTEEKNLSFESKKDLVLNMPIEELNLSVRTFNCLKRAEINTVKNLLQCSTEDMMYIRNLGMKSRNEIITKLRSLGLELRKACYYCNSTLLEKDLEIGDQLCNSCRERVARTLKAKDITLKILPPESGSYTGGYDGFHIYINIENNTSYPVKLELKECSIFKEGRQRISDYNLIGYSFSEDYIFPHSVKTFAKIWKTEEWTDKNICSNDCLTISLKNVSSNKIYFFKYKKISAGWDFYDYYELDN
jgi:hypothetical protein